MNGAIWAVVGVVPVVVAAALWQRTRRRDVPTAIPSHQAPTWIDPADLGVGPIAADGDPGRGPWLVALFSSATCGGCAQVWQAAEVLRSDAVVVRQFEFAERPDLHERYGITAVPTLVIADRTGLVHRSFLGSVSATHLWAAVAGLRDPDAVPPGCGGDH